MSVKEHACRRNVKSVIAISWVMSPFVPTDVWVLVVYFQCILGQSVQLPSSNDSLPGSGGNLPSSGNSSPKPCVILPSPCATKPPDKILPRPDHSGGTELRETPEQRAAGIKLSRIVGGYNCDIAANPFLVSFIDQHSQEYYCGGTLVAWKWVLSAAHCFPEKVNSKNDEVKAGSNTARSGEMAQRGRIKKVHLHPKYVDRKYKNDIAMVKLKTEFKKSAFVQLAKLPPPHAEKVSLNTEPDCKTVLTMGWGKTEAFRGKRKAHGKATTRSWSQLKCVQLPMVQNAICNQRLGGWIQNQVVCTMHAAGGQDACTGDSGGPLLCDNQRDTIFGVVSAGKGCAMPNTPAMFTRVDQYLDFVNDRLRNTGTSRNKAAVASKLLSSLCSFHHHILLLSVTWCLCVVSYLIQ